MAKLTEVFYTRSDVVQIAKDLLGKCLFTNINNTITAGIITETEAYGGITDKASHAYNNKRTKRTEVMYAKGGVSYVYLCYGIHHLFNVVTNVKDVPHAVLIRGIHPVKGISTILQRRNSTKINSTLTSGPGKVSQSLGITTALTNIGLSGDKIWIEDKGIQLADNDILNSKRIGIDYAEEDSLLPYRFCIHPAKLEDL